MDGPAGRLAASGDGSIILAGDRPPCARGGDDTPLSRSDDGGATWREVAGVDGVRPLASWPDERIADGASCGGLEISTDGGQTWQSLPLPDSNWTPSSLAVVTGEDQPGPAALVVGVPEGGGGRPAENGSGGEY